MVSGRAQSHQLDERVVRKGCRAALHCARGANTVRLLVPRDLGVVSCVFIKFRRLCDVGSARYLVAVTVLPLGVSVTVRAVLLLLLVI